MTRTVTPTLETLMGQYVNLLDPDPETIDLTDVARGLAYTVRFSGQITRYYSVAEHALNVADYVFDATKDPALTLAALHHDSHEAYLCDWPAPVKVAAGTDVFDELALRLDRAIATAFTIGYLGMSFDDPFENHIIKRADRETLYREAATLKPSRGVGPHWGNDWVYQPLPGAGLPAEYAERLFVERHQSLIEARMESS